MRCASRIPAPFLRWHRIEARAGRAAKVHLGVTRISAAVLCLGPHEEDGHVIKGLSRLDGLAYKTAQTPLLKSIPLSALLARLTGRIPPSTAATPHTSISRPFSQDASASLVTAALSRAVVSVLLVFLVVLVCI